MDIKDYGYWTFVFGDSDFRADCPSYEARQFSVFKNNNKDTCIRDTFNGQLIYFKSYNKKCRAYTKISRLVVADSIIEIISTRSFIHSHDRPYSILDISRYKSRKICKELLRVYKSEEGKVEYFVNGRSCAKAYFVKVKNRYFRLLKRTDNKFPLLNHK